MAQSAYATFKEYRKNKTDDTAQVAKRLVNVFRHLDYFGESYEPTYNQMLLEAHPTVLAFLPSITGGDEVLEYLDFLRNKTESDTPKEESTDYLPSPGDITPFQSDYLLKEILEKQNTLLEKQTEILEKLTHVLTEK